MPEFDGNQVALVTGAGRGIGRVVAQRLSSAGMRVALSARSEDELKDAAATCPGPTLTLPADITDVQAPDRLFDEVEQQWGPVGVLVANAGAGASARVHKTTDDDWQRMLELNLTAPFRCIRRALPAMIAAGAGRVIVVASITARVGEPYLGAYSASKHGVLGLVRSAAAELARSGVTVNAVCPAYVDSPMTDHSIAEIAERTGRSQEDVRSILEHKQPMGRLVTTDEVAEAVLFCLNTPSVTGQAVNVDGGAVQS